MSDANPNILIITGSAPCVLQDIEAASFVIPAQAGIHYMGIGLDAVDKYTWPIKYVATYHPVEIPEIYVRRDKCGGNMDFQTISHERRPEVDIFIPFEGPSGSSTLLGVFAALKLGYKKIILCGCPLEDDKYKSFQNGWKVHLDKYVGKVRSMSGWTREFLGAPTMEWLLDGR